METTREFKYDDTRPASYLKLTDEPVARTEELGQAFMVLADYDGDNQLVGVEILWECTPFASASHTVRTTFTDARAVGGDL